MIKNKIKVALGIVLFTISSVTHAQKFKVVLDPGHGGKDFGAVRNNNVEKKIVLDVALRVGKILEKERSIDVVYTRKTDVFIELKRRSQIANEEKADIFVSIHANAAASSDASGTETFVMGNSKTASNLEVAKKENSVITLEDDYKTSYAGFDPNKPESLIGLTLVQEQYVAQSIELASKVQGKFTNDLKRKNRGVKQGPFWVLHGAFMPSILIELGFVSNPDEGAYLNSDEGREALARSVANAILDYKKQYHSNNSIKNVAVEPVERPVVAETPARTKEVEPAKTSSIEVSGPEKETKSGVRFMVQLAASSKEIATSPANFKGLSNVSVVKEGSSYKYYYNETSDINRARKALEEAKNKGYTSAFLVAYKKGKKVSIQEALK